MRVLLAQLSPVLGDVDGNLSAALRAVSEARARGCRLVVFPELLLSGYPPRDLLERHDLIDACAAAVERLAQASGSDLILVFGAPVQDGELLRNAALVASGGAVVARVWKTLLPTYDVFDEARYFTAGTSPAPVEVEGLRLGVTICEDIWGESALFGSRRYRVDPMDALTGCDLIVNLSASPFHAAKSQVRRDLVARQAARAGAPLIYCNMVGGNDELLFDGHSLVIGPDGALYGEGASFAEDLLVVDLDHPSGAAPFERPFEEEVVEALTMGIRDYAARCGFKTAVLGLSGGIDSALVAALAARALGPDAVYAVGMPGPFSSEGSITDARDLAQNLGIHFDIVPVNGVYTAFLDALERPFAGRARDVAEENLQARARGTVLMALSNKFGHLLLTTGNKSEMAVGYCTLYGDMNGGLAVIADVFKTDVYRLCRWLNREREIIPVSTLTKPPSAELAPNQKDQDSLPPYDVLDAILRAYVEGMVDPADIIDAGHDPATVERVVRLVVKSEYKRWQAPPGLRVSPKAFGMGRRMPLAQRWHLTGRGVR